ncbi:hypothetical protein TSAR_012291 [Trichomalopsis sarcophagae]|uniref:Uncharacterized protein n=1 Tax=Trichomalopsis sarcophagae TaxID=543379 RepID=A0A232FNB5_9HYME|nr:hypothetical protein TSAR_012291 [Trichomalopsis sarcophagae]
MQLPEASYMFTAFFLLSILFAGESARFYLAYCYAVISSSTLQSEGLPICLFALTPPVSEAYTYTHTRAHRRTRTHTVKMDQVIEKPGGRAEYQYGFRTKRSTLDAISLVVDTARTAKEEKKMERMIREVLCYLLHCILKMSLTQLAGARYRRHYGKKRYPHI